MRILKGTKRRIGLDTTLEAGIGFRQIGILCSAKGFHFTLLLGTLEHFGGGRTVFGKGNAEIRNTRRKGLHLVAFLRDTFKALRGFLEERIIHDGLDNV